MPDQDGMFTGDIVENHSACYCGDGHFNDWDDALANIAACQPRTVAPDRGDALLGEVMVTKAIANTADFVNSTYRAAARVAARGGSLKEAWNAVRATSAPNLQIIRSMSTACPSTLPAPMTKRAASTPPPESGPSTATARWGTKLKAEATPLL